MAKANPAPRATVADTADHIDHIRKVAGIDHIGLGGDFDGITSVPEGLEDVSKYPALTAELLRRGYKDDEVKKILGLNILRVMRRPRACRQSCRSSGRVGDVVHEVMEPQDPKLTIVAHGRFDDGGHARAGSRRSKRRRTAPATRRSQYAYWLMQAHPDWVVLNHGVNGERSDQILARFERDVDRREAGGRRDHRRRQRRLPGT